MHRLLLAMLFVAALTAAPAGRGIGQNKQAQCEQSDPKERNWEVIADEYVYFDYILCPPGTDPPNPLVRIWITTHGDGIAVEKWAQDRDGADVVSMFHGKKKAYTLYRDLKAIPLKVFKAESRAAVPADMAGQPFLAEGSNLVPLENLVPDSALKVGKLFENADALIRQSQHKVALIRETPRIAAILESLATTPKAKK